VLFAHSFALTGNGGAYVSGMIYKIFRVPDFGGFGVNIFFILSGFLIMMSYDRCALNKNGDAKYLKNRALRILPALYATLLLSSLVYGPLLTTFDLPRYFSDKDFWLYLCNVTLLPLNFFQVLPGVFPNNPYTSAINGSLWTITVETAFYIMILLIGIIKQHKNKTLILAGFAFTTIIYALADTETFITNRYILLTSRLLIPFVLGMLAYMYRDKIRLNVKLAVISLAGLLLCFRIFGSDGHILACVFLAYLLLFLGLKKQWRVSRLLSKAGDFSYGVYVYAFPVQQITVDLFLRKGVAVSQSANFFISLSFTLVLAILSWHFIEKKFLKFKHSRLT
jgi:peptidoglycan/LPS O-acetylase OafA/YrhL